MGGGNALAAAAADPGVAAAVSQVPFLTMRQAHRSPLRVQARMLAAAVRGRHLPAVGQPAEAAFINAPGGEDGWRHVVASGEDSRWRNRASSRWLLTSPFAFNHVRHARRLHCPWLVCVGEADRVAAPGIAIRAARRAPLGELRTYPGVDHFDIYDGPEHEAVVADEIEFLRRHLRPGMSSPGLASTVTDQCPCTAQLFPAPTSGAAPRSSPRSGRRAGSRRCWSSWSRPGPTSSASTSPTPGPSGRRRRSRRSGRRPSGSGARWRSSATCRGRSCGSARCATTSPSWRPGCT